MVERQHSFLGCAARGVSGPDAPYIALPIPYERTVSYGPGTARGPAAIVEASEQIELWDEELGLDPGLRVQTLPAIECGADSDEAVLGSIRTVAEPHMARERFVMGLGGEHTISAPLVAAASSVFGRLSVLQLDAHSDLRDSFRGVRLSHACVMRRVLELGASVVHVGIRSMSEEERDLARARSLPVFWARDIVESRTREWIGEVVRLLGPKVYVTIDIDGLDPGLAPGTGTPEPGGLGWYDALALLRAVCSERTVVAADIVEVAPVAGFPLTEYVAARLAAKIMAYHACLGSARCAFGA